MAHPSPAVVIDNGSFTTKAGFALEDLPLLVFSSNYALDENQHVIVGDNNIANNPTSEVMTLLENGVVYNYENIVHNWQYVYDNLDNGSPISASEYPLVLTEQTWNTSKGKLAAAQTAFETLQVPIFLLVKTPLAQLYHKGKSSGLVIDLGASSASVTPILDGIVQHKSTFHSKYAGDFGNLHVLNSLHGKLGDDYLSKMLPKRYVGTTPSESFKNYHVSHNFLHQFKQLVLLINEFPPQFQQQVYQNQPAPAQTPSHFQLANGSYVTVSADEKINLLEGIFQPQQYELPNIKIPEGNFEKPATHGISNLVLLTLKHLEGSFLTSVADGQQTNSNAYAKFNEVLRELLTGLVITGGSSLAAGLSERIMADVRRNVAQILPNYPLTQPGKLYIQPLRNPNLGELNETWDKQFGGWLGAANLASMLNDVSEEEGAGGLSSGASIALDNWFITKADYEELGEDIVLEKFK